MSMRIPRSIIIGLVGACVVFLGCLAASLEYTVTIGQEHEGAHVRAVARHLEGSSIELGFSTEAAYVGSYVTDLETNRGSARSAGSGRWRVSSRADSITYEYDIPNVVPWQSHVVYQSTSDVAVYIDSTCAIFMAPHLFIFPDRQDFTSIRVRFDIPDDWQVVAPYEEVEHNTFRVRRVNRQLITDFKSHQIYMGKMRFYAEEEANGCVVKLGKLMADDSPNELTSQAEVRASVAAMAKALLALEDLFGENPFTVYTLVPNFKHTTTEGCYYFRPHYLGSSLQHWPEHRWDELIGHAAMAWVETAQAPLRGGKEFKNGMGEFYYGLLYAWEIYRDPAYLGKRYVHYLVYDWMFAHHDRPPTSYQCGTCDEYDVYFRWEFICLLLDHEIQSRTGGRYRLADALRWLYARYKNSARTIVASDLERAIESTTGTEISDFFDEYVYQDSKLPVYRHVASYREHFLAYGERFEQLRFHDYMRGHTVAWFINIVMAASLATHIPHGLGVLEYPVDFAEFVLSNYELEDLTEQDVIDALGTLTDIDCSGFFTHWEDSYGRLTLESVVDWLRDYKAIGRSGAIDFRDAGTLSWDGELIAGQGKEIRIEVKDQDYLIQLGATPVTRFVVKFRTPSGQGEVIQGYPSFCWNTDQGFYEEVHIPLTRLEDCWVGTVTIIPCSSIDQFMVMQTAWGGRTFFGAAARVLPNSDD